MCVRIPTKSQNRLKKEVTLSADFEALWNRIKPKTTYRVEFETDALANRAISALKKVEKIEPPKIRVTAGRVEVQKGGVAAEAVSAAEERVTNSRHAVPDPSHIILPDASHSNLKTSLKGLVQPMLNPISPHGLVQSLVSFCSTFQMAEVLEGFGSEPRSGSRKMLRTDDVDEELQRGFGLSINELEPLLKAGGDAAEMKFMECCRYLWQADGAELTEPFIEALFNKLPAKSRCVLFQRMLTIVYVAQDGEPLSSARE